MNNIDIIMMSLGCLNPTNCPITGRFTLYGIRRVSYGEHCAHFRPIFDLPQMEGGLLHPAAPWDSNIDALEHVHHS